MQTQLDKIFAIIAESEKLSEKSGRFSDIIKSGCESCLILYHADADGFAAGYFIYQIMSRTGDNVPKQIKTRAVWNQEFDFAWLPQYCDEINPDIIISVDIPLFHAPHLLKKIASLRMVAIYDHHVIGNNIRDIENVLYINSRLPASGNIDLPACFFAASLAHRENLISENDLPILACGLHGDKALKDNEHLLDYLQNQLSGTEEKLQSINSFIERLTSRINILYKANPLENPENIFPEITEFLKSNSVMEMIAWLSRQYQLEDAEKRISSEIGNFLGLLRRAIPSREGLLCEVIACKTFCIGILASILAAEKPAPVVAIGFHTESRIQYELRTAEDSQIDLTRLLQEQRRYFTPISSGGHPQAAGALIYADDIRRFRESLRLVMQERG